MIIAIDFDGTCVTHRYPKVGEDIGAVPVLKKLIENGHKLILLTMRDCGDTLRDAIEWFNKNGIPLYAINQNPEQNWSSSRKVYADLYIDDQAVGCPLIRERYGTRSYVDWPAIDWWFQNMGAY